MKTWKCWLLQGTKLTIQLLEKLVRIKLGNGNLNYKSTCGTGKKIKDVYGMGNFENGQLIDNDNYFLTKYTFISSSLGGPI